MLYHFTLLCKDEFNITHSQKRLRDHINTSKILASMDVQTLLFINLYNVINALEKTDYQEFPRYTHVRDMIYTLNL